jgi:hypothetical protein
MKKHHKTVVVIILSIIMIGLFMSIFITVDETPPGNAVVIVTQEDKLYHSIFGGEKCLLGKTAKTMTLSEAIKEGYKPHQYDVDLGYFRGNRRFLFYHILSKLGVNVNSRWDSNGDWLW